MTDVIIQNTPLSTKLDNEMLALCSREESLLHEKKETNRSIQGELNLIAQEKAQKILEKQHALFVDAGGPTLDAKREHKKWCADVGGIQRRMVDNYLTVGRLLGNNKFLVARSMSVRTLIAVASKDFTKKEMVALSHWSNTDRPVSAQKVHVWAHDECGRDLPLNAKRIHYANIYSERPQSAQTIEGRLKLGYTAHALLGVTPGTPDDVVDIVCRAFSHKFHPDKGGNTAEFQRVREAIEEVKGK